jgi:RNA polymerase sigma factor (sigma-70 family)
MAEHAGDELSAHELLILYRQGDLHAFDILVAHYLPRFYRYAKRRGLTHEDAEDAAQEAFLQIAASINSYDDRRRGGAGWMWAIMQSKAIDAVRRVRGQTLRAVEIDDASLDFLADTLEEWLEIETQVLGREAILTAFRAAWNELAPEDQEELKRHPGRGPGRKTWHEAAARFRDILERHGVYSLEWREWRSFNT